MDDIEPALIAANEAALQASRRTTAGASIAALFALIAFSRCLLDEVQFTNFDDDRNYERNIYLHTFSLENLAWIFRDGTLIGVYEPASNLLKMALMATFGVSPRTVSPVARSWGVEVLSRGVELGC